MERNEKIGKKLFITGKGRCNITNEKDISEFFENNEELLEAPLIKDLIREQVDAVNRDLARYEQIKYYAVLEQPFSIDTGELTPTLKVKRRVVYDKYKDRIQSMYEQ